MSDSNVKLTLEEAVRGARVRLHSPYGHLRTHCEDIDNGTEGTVKCLLSSGGVRVDFDLSVATADVPEHWLEWLDVR